MTLRFPVRWSVALALLNALLLTPQWLRVGELGPPWIALEAPALAALMVLLPAGRGVARLRWLVVLLVLAFLLVGLGEAATWLSFGRPLNLYLDLPLLRSVFHLLEGNLGGWLALLVSLAGLAGLVVTAWLVAWALRSLQPVRGGARSAGLALMVLAASAALVHAERHYTRWPTLARAPLVDTLVFQTRQWVETRRAHRDFATRLESAPAPARELPGLAGKDVLLVFVESYGVSALFDERYSATLRPRLTAMAERFATAGLSVASGTLDSPIRGGQSWLAHATVLSGLWIDNPLWYRLMLASDRATLVDDFRASGHRTHSVMPAITRHWPEGEAYGFDELHTVAELGYAGPALNWVTMPDQYTLHRFQQHIRQSSDSPILAQIALISSHAPWTPILPVLDWAEVGDGQVFQRWESAGEPPDVLWQDIERVRDHYALALDYALHISASWAERHVNADTLMILLGDHQSAPLITGDDDAGDGVPVHVISGDASLLAPFVARGFAPGIWPTQDPEPPGMDRLRRWLHEDFGTPREAAR